MHIPRFVYSAIDGHVGCSHLLAMVNSAALNMSVPMFLQDPASRFAGLPLS